MPRSRQVARKPNVTKATSNAACRAEDRGQIERQLQIFKAQLAALEKRRQDLANEEALLSQQISTDQGRWSDVNTQLDQLERSLTPPKQ